MGAALEGILGFKPVHGLVVVVVVSLALVGGVLLLATTPGGLAALPALVMATALLPATRGPQSLYTLQTPGYRSLGPRMLNEKTPD